MMDFMDTLRRGVDRAGYELDRLLRANRVRSQLNGLRSQMDEEIREIGKSAMELYQRGEPLHDALRERCERVVQYQAEIREKEAELADIEKETAGPAFGEAQEPERAERIDCPKCGTFLPPDAAFCLKCGARLSPKEQARADAEAEERPEGEAEGQSEDTDETTPPEPLST